MKTLDVLQTVEWAMKHFGSLATSRQCTRRDVLREVKKGLVESSGFGALCDDDGFAVNSSREVKGFVLTDAGKDLLRKEEAAYQERWRLQREQWDTEGK